MLSVMIIYIFIDNRYYLVLQSIHISLKSTKYPEPNIHLVSDRYKKFFSRSSIDLDYSRPSFQPIASSSSYPYLPIHLFTQNVASLSNVTKLILLANGFFGDANWGLGEMNKSSQDLSKNTLQLN